MAIQIQGNSGVVAEVDGTTFRAQRVTVRPTDYGALSYNRISAFSGTIGAALAANSELFQFRWDDATRFCLIQKIKVSAAVVAVATAAGVIGWNVTIARGWSAAGSGGTRLTTSGDNQSLRTSMGASLLTASDVGIATTGALTAGTKTLDANPISTVVSNVGTGAVTTYQVQPLLPLTDLYDASEVQHPIVLADNEGFVLRTTHAGPTALTYVLSVDVVWAEVTAF